MLVCHINISQITHRLWSKCNLSQKFIASIEVEGMIRKLLDVCSYVSDVCYATELDKVVQCAC